jgi:hypothetical protein|tara:strand:- start:3531 stop:4667 length:1137 start_codon:yes stop_codon:yes gene_type:complete
MKIALVTSNIEIYSTYDFNKGLDEQAIKNDIEKSNSFNFFDHDNLFLRKLHLLLYDNKIEIKHLQNYTDKNEVDIFYFIGFTKYHPNIISLLPPKKIKILQINEPPAVNSVMHEKKTFKKFDYIFTSNRNIVDDKKFFFINGHTNISKNNKRIKNNKFFFSSFLVANRPSYHPTSNHEKKIEIIQWFENNQPLNFHLYGSDWDKYKIIGNGWFPKILKKIKGHRILHIVNRIINKIYRLPVLKKYFYLNLKVYKGFVDNKIDTISKYKFDFCIENSSYPGFITTRIFHCFLANTVPVYLGPKDIEKFIPGNCIVNLNNFNSISELYDFLKNINDKEYEIYLRNISNFLNSKNFEDFCLEYDVNKLCNKFKSFALTKDI